MSVSFYPYNYEQALACLEAARNPSLGRPLQNNTRLVYASVDDTECVGVLLHSTVVVAYLPNGNTVLNSGGWHTVTTKDRINNWSPARVYSGYRYNIQGEQVSPYTQWLVTSSPLGTSPAAVKKCRACKGIGSDSYQVEGDWVNGTYVPYDKPMTHTVTCYRCSGTGQRDYGSHKVYPTFEDGVIVNQAGEVVGYGPPPLQSFRHIRMEQDRRGAWRPAPALHAALVDSSSFDNHDEARWTPDLEDKAERIAAEVEAEIHAWARMLGNEE